MAEGSEKQEMSVYAFSATGPSPLDAQRAWTADVIVEQLEGECVADREFVERGAVAHVAPMEEHVATGRQPDEPVALADEERHDAARARHATAFRRRRRRHLASRRRLSDGAARVLAHVLTSAVPTADDVTGHHRNRRRARLWDGLR